MNLTDILAAIRRDLKDEDCQNYRWSDAELSRHIAHAVKDFSLCLPVENKVDLPTISGSREIDISSLLDRINVEAVEYPIGLSPICWQRFSIWSDILTLVGEDLPDGSDCTIYYTQVHTLDDRGSTIPSQYEELIATGACGYAALSWAGYAVNRVNTGGAGTPGDFLAWGQDKLSAFRGDIRKLGRRNQVRINQLYTPCGPPVSQTTDWGP